MKLNKKGFTLVELLAVIVVLAIIALIGYTAVGPIITDSRNSSAENNILQYIHSVEVGCAAYQATNNGTTNIDITKALSKANFTGNAPTGSTTTGTVAFKLDGSTCKVTSDIGSTATSNDVSCTYKKLTTSSTDAEWVCGE